MIPFMETQSASLGYAFGINYEYGKRKIKSMSNETFNSLTPDNLTEMTTQRSTALIDEFVTKIPNFNKMQEIIIDNFFKLEQRKLIENVKLAEWTLSLGEKGLGNIASGIYNLLTGNTQQTQQTQTIPKPITKPQVESRRETSKIITPQITPRQQINDLQKQYNIQFQKTKTALNKMNASGRSRQASTSRGHALHQANGRAYTRELSKQKSLAASLIKLRKKYGIFN